MNVLIPTPLRSYTQDKAKIRASGSSLEELLADIDRQCPGFRFRIVDEQDQIRPHIKIFIDQQQARTLQTPLHESGQVMIVCALSGG